MNLLRFFSLLLAAAVTSAAAGATESATPSRTVRLGAFSEDIGRMATQAVEDDAFVAWVATDNAEYRLAVLIPLPAGEGELLQAFLGFEAQAWQNRRDCLTVETLALPENIADAMYLPGEPLLAGGDTLKNYRLDVTRAVRSALAAGRSHLLLRFSIAADENAGAGKAVLDIGCTIRDITLRTDFGTAAFPEKSDCYTVTAAGEQSEVTLPGTLANLIAAAGGDFATVVLPGNRRYRLDGELEIPASIELDFRRGAILEIGPSGKLVFNGSLNAGPVQLFELQGTLEGQLQAACVYPQWFGAAGDGVSDDTMPLQQSVDFACVSGIGKVDLNRGEYRLTRTLDCTNTRLPGTVNRDALNLTGSSLWKTKLIGDAGDGFAVIDASGGQCSEFTNFMITSGNRNPSTVGVFTGCGELLPQSQNQLFHLAIFMHDDPAANDGFGTIGVWNFAAEEHTYSSMYVSANRPMVLTAFNDNPNPAGPLPLNFKNSYVKLLKVHSLGVTTFAGESFLQSRGAGNPVFTLQCANTVNAVGIYMHAAGGTAFEIYGGLMTLNYSGVLEGGATLFKNFGTLENADIAMTYGLVGDPSLPAILMSESSQILNSDIRIAMAEHRDRPLIGALTEVPPAMHPDPEAMAREIARGQANDIAPSIGLEALPVRQARLVNTRIWSNQPLERLRPPEFLRAGSRNSQILGHDGIFELTAP